MPIQLFAKQRKQFSFSMLVFVLSNLLLLSAAVAQTFPPASSCTSKDLTLVGANLTGGNVCNSCTPGTQLTRTLSLSINNTTGSTRTSFAFWGTLEIYDGNTGLLKSSTSITGCNGPLPPSSISTLTFNNITYGCGDLLQITNLYLAWTDASPNSTCPLNPSTINPKCGTLPAIQVNAGVNGSFAVTNLHCYGANTGAINLTPTGGTAPYTYSWTASNGGVVPAGQATNKDLTGLVAGTYSVIIKDANNCVITKSRDITGPTTALALGTCSKTDASCAGGDGSVTAGTVANAVGTVSYSWKNAANTVVGTVASVSNLPAGNYTLTVSDDCSSQTCSVTINSPTKLSTPTATPTAPACGQTNGTVQITNYDNTLAYTLNQGNTVISSTPSNTGLFTGVAPGTYTVVASKTGNCPATSTNVVVNNPPSNLTAPTASATSPACGQTNGTVQITNYDNTLAYTLNQGNTVISSTPSNTGLFTGVAPGTYTVVASKTGNCPATSTNVVVNNPPSNLTAPTAMVTNPVCGAPTGSVQVTNFGASVTYVLSQSSVTKYTANGTGLFSNVAPGIYDLVASKTGSCSATGSVTIVPSLPCGGPIYTYTQGYYHGTGTACTPNGSVKGGIALIQLSISHMLNMQLYLGKSGASFTANYSDAAKLSSILPGGGSPTNLAKNYNLSSSANYPPLKNGRINNVLLSQTITLALNLNIPGNGLSGFVLKDGYLTTMSRSGSSCTSAAATCANGGTISSMKLTTNPYLMNLLRNNTVSYLLTLASNALGGTLPANVSYADISNVVDVINNSFDEGRFFLGYFATQQSCMLQLSVPLSGTPITSTQSIISTQHLSVTTYPNPFTDKIKFSIVSPISGKASLDIYNVMGQKLATIYQGYLFAGRGEVIDYNVPSIYKSTLIYNLKVGDKQVNGKLIQIK